MREQERRSQAPDPKQEQLKELYWEMFGIPLEWSMDLSKYDSELGEFHRKRLNVFTQLLEDKKKK